MRFKLDFRWRPNNNKIIVIIMSILFDYFGYRSSIINIKASFDIIGFRIARTHGISNSGTARGPFGIDGGIVGRATRVDIAGFCYWFLNTVDSAIEYFTSLNRFWSSFDHDQPL